MTEKKYEFTGETREVDGVTVREIRALRTIPYRADPGDRGGWLQDETNLSPRGNCWVGVNAVVMEHARVADDARVTGHALVRGQARAVVQAHVTSHAVLSGNAYVTDRACVGGNARVFEQAMLCDDTSVDDDAQVQGTAQTYGRTRVEADAIVSGDAELRDATVSYGATVQGRGQVIVLSGLFAGTLTLYRAANLPGGHRVQAGCQNLRLDQHTDSLRALAARHEWVLPPGWRGLRAALLTSVRAWERLREAQVDDAQPTA